METTMTKSKRRLLTVGEKLEVIRDMMCGQKNYIICQKYQLPSSTVSTLWKSREKILAAHASNNFSSKRLRQCEKVDLDTELLQWYRTMRNQTTISGPILMTQANKIAATLGYQNFSCSHGWINRFKKRHNIMYTKNRGIPDNRKETVKDDIEAFLEIVYNDADTEFNNLNQISNDSDDFLIKNIDTGIYDENISESLRNRNEDIVSAKNQDNEVKEPRVEQENVGESENKTNDVVKCEEIKTKFKSQVNEMECDEVENRVKWEHMGKQDKIFQCSTEMSIIGRSNSDTTNVPDINCDETHNHVSLLDARLACQTLLSFYKSINRKDINILNHLLDIKNNLDNETCWNLLKKESH